LRNTATTATLQPDMFYEYTFGPDAGPPPGPAPAPPVFNTRPGH
jgi:hypothetical protein